MNTQSQPTPIPITPDSAPVDDAILALKEALDDLGKFRVRPDEQAPRAPELIISPDEAKACIKGELLRLHIFPGQGHLPKARLATHGSCHANLCVFAFML